MNTEDNSIGDKKKDCIYKSDLCAICPSEHSRKKPQGKLNVKKVLMGVLKGDKRKDIAEDAGSIAKSDSAKCQAVDNVINSSKYKEEAGTLVDKLDIAIKRLANELTKRELDSTNYKDMSSSIEKLTKLKELLTGGATDRVNIDAKDVKKFLSKA